MTTRSAPPMPMSPSVELVTAYKGSPENAPNIRFTHPPRSPCLTSQILNCQNEVINYKSRDEHKPYTLPIGNEIRWKMIHTTHHRSSCAQNVVVEMALTSSRSKDFKFHNGVIKQEYLQTCSGNFVKYTWFPSVTASIAPLSNIDPCKKVKEVGCCNLCPITQANYKSSQSKLQFFPSPPLYVFHKRQRNCT